MVFSVGFGMGLQLLFGWLVDWLGGWFQLQFSRCLVG